MKCLKQWIESGQDNYNTCPLCREQLFSEIDKPEFVEGARRERQDLTMTHQIQTWDDAKKFVKTIWRAMYKFYERDQIIYDSDIEEAITDALAGPPARYNSIQGLYIFSGHWPTIGYMAKDMVQEHYRNGSFVPLIGMPLRGYLYSVEGPLQWQLEGSESTDEEASDEEGGDDDMLMAESAE
ncbi:hypothetical protein J4E93_003754 [Alternaria ventricosa]|uniref:uncharacterized protein n=1 Tax=Alternaria ventricosa TaxID=1187951 RepID=UPI0020C572C8|nr:uncharacterized protein J4E93_003754 [Alternaria ventricosa]KAI4649436.1 hypothetical protein J4E93_003754 [Alternaria ventricosa]